MNPEEREEMRRHVGVVTEDFQSQLRTVAEGNAMTAEALQRLNDKVDAFRGDFDASRLDAAREFAAVRSEVANGLTAVRTEMADGLTAVRAEMADGFASLHSAIASGRAGIPLPRRPRTRRRPH